MELVKSGR